MKQVRRLEIITARTVNEVFAGSYTSAFKGRGMEFAEVREYQPGDEIRTIDWNVTARTGVPHIKRFVEERELTVILAADLSASGLFASGKRFKQEAAAELCGVLAFAATRSNDRVGLLTFTDRVESHIPPAKGVNHVLRIIRELLDARPAGRGTDIAAALEHLRRVQKRRAVVFVVSDFFDAGLRPPAPDAPSRLETALRLCARRHDVIAAIVRDPRERELPRAGLIELLDAETGERRTVDASSRRVRQAFAAHAAARDELLARTVRRSGVDQLSISPDEPYTHALVELFRRREARR